MGALNAGGVCENCILDEHLTIGLMIAAVHDEQ